MLGFELKKLVSEQSGAAYALYIAVPSAEPGKKYNVTQVQAIDAAAEERTWKTTNHDLVQCSQW